MEPASLIPQTMVVEPKTPVVEPVAPAVEDGAPKPAAATWRELEPTDPSDPVPHVETVAMDGKLGWIIAGASRRGKMHAHRAGYREDALAVAVAGPWQLAAVSDGAGSAPLSRVGSHLAVETAITALARSLEGQAAPSDEALAAALREALEAAHAALHAEAKRRAIAPKDLAATFLLMAFGTVKGNPVVGTLQVGDGLIALRYLDDRIEALSKPDSGAFGGETYFLTSRPAEAWRDRAEVRHLAAMPALLVVMSDGVADDLIPYEEHLPRFFSRVAKTVAGGLDGDTAAQRLSELIAYDKRGSFDDRTIVVMTKP